MDDTAVNLARVEERIIALDQKVELHQQRDSDQHHLLQSEIRSVHQLLVMNLKEQSVKIERNSDDINSLKRDRVWIVSLFGLIWAGLVMYFEYRFRA
jgi:hypothetical protein